ncbi:hypothetical protein AAFF_G00252570 [Aldrovandia affinis]|uniref:Uncharacterized protein n=1 Tax=Aldrovandia affinis TaxID=143900 RepID=A0AAD7SUX2_9TELE|nr:hypothetical protein AAFF_G00252570 [Aldrovandia affinis]
MRASAEGSVSGRGARRSDVCPRSDGVICWPCWVTRDKGDLVPALAHLEHAQSGAPQLTHGPLKRGDIHQTPGVEAAQLRDRGGGGVALPQAGLINVHRTLRWCS